MLKLYSEIEQNKSISDFVEPLLSITQERNADVWLIGQYLLSKEREDIFLPQNLIQKLIRVENNLLTSIANFSDINQFYEISMLSLNKYNKTFDSAQLLKIIIERDFKKNDKRNLQLEEKTFNSFENFDNTKEIALYRSTVKKSEFEHKATIRILEEVGLYEEAFEVYFEKKKLCLISKKNKKFVDQFSYLLEGVGENLVFKGDRKLVKAYVEFEKNVYHVDKEKAEGYLEDLVQELAMFKHSNLEDVIQKKI